MDWRLQILMAGAKATIPGKRTLRRWKRALKPQAPHIDSTALPDALHILRLLRESGKPLEGSTVLEIGSGWYPVLPVLCAALGARRGVMTDIERYVDAPAFRAARDHVLTHADRIADETGADPATLRRRVQKAFVPSDLGLEYVAPFDPAAWPARSVDILLSRAVLEHISARELGQLLPQWRALLAPGGLMLHGIDNSDHCEHRDPNLSRIEFLCRSERFWHLIEHFWNHNRLRHSDYLALFRTAGLAIAHAEAQIDERALEDARRLPLAPPFDRYDAADLATLTSWIVARAG